MCLAIEPKLETVHKMLKNSSRLIDPTNPEKIMVAIDELSTNLTTFQKAAALDVEYNMATMQEGFTTFKNFIRQTSKA